MLQNVARGLDEGKDLISYSHRLVSSKGLFTPSLLSSKALAFQLQLQMSNSASDSSIVLGFRRFTFEFPLSHKAHRVISASLLHPSLPPPIVEAIKWGGGAP